MTVGEGAPSDPLGLDPDHTYRQQHEAILSGRAEEACGLAEGLEVVHLIDAAERAAATRVWVRR